MNKYFHQKAVNSQTRSQGLHKLKTLKFGRSPDISVYVTECNQFNQCQAEKCQWGHFKIQLIKYCRKRNYA